MEPWKCCESTREGKLLGGKVMVVTLEEAEVPGQLRGAAT